MICTCMVGFLGSPFQIAFVRSDPFGSPTCPSRVFWKKEEDQTTTGTVRREKKGPSLLLHTNATPHTALWVLAESSQRNDTRPSPSRAFAGITTSPLHHPTTATLHHCTATSSHCNLLRFITAPPCAHLLRFTSPRTPLDTHHTCRCSSSTQPSA